MMTSPTQDAAVAIAVSVMFALLAMVFWLDHRSNQRRERKRRQGEVLAARWEVIEAAEAVIQTADKFCIGMPTELEDAVERLRAALEEERRAV